MIIDAATAIKGVARGRGFHVWRCLRQLASVCLARPLWMGPFLCKPSQEDGRFERDGAIEMIRLPFLFFCSI